MNRTPRYITIALASILSIGGFSWYIYQSTLLVRHQNELTRRIERNIEQQRHNIEQQKQSLKVMNDYKRERIQLSESMNELYQALRERREALEELSMAIYVLDGKIDNLGDAVRSADKKKSVDEKDD